MKGISKNDRGYLKIFLIILLFAILSGCNGTNPVINSFFASPSAIIAGDSTTLSWTVTDADSVTIDYGIGTVALTGITTVNPTTDTTYTLITTNSTGPVIATVTVTVAPIETLTLQPGSEGKDAYVMDIFSEDNFGDIIFLSVGVFTVPFARSYLQFDLSPLPSEVVILDASLGLYYDSPYNLFSLPIGLYEVAENWVENTLTWNNQPASSNEAVDIQIILASQTNDFVYWYIADLVKGWHEGSISNYGIVLRDTDESSDNGGVEFFSSDWLTANQRPKLIIDFYVP